MYLCLHIGASIWPVNIFPSYIAASHENRKWYNTSQSDFGCFKQNACWKFLQLSTGSSFKDHFIIIWCMLQGIEDDVASV
jgi:hypothetical protein